MEKPARRMRRIGNASRTPPVCAGGGSVGHVLDLIRRAGGLTRAEIIEKSGLSRTTVAARLERCRPPG